MALKAMSGSNRYLARAQELLDRGRRLPSTVGADGRIVSGYTTGHLAAAVLVSLGVGAGLGALVVLLVLQVGFHLVPLTPDQKRGVDMIQAATGWDWINRLSPNEIGYRLTLDDEIAEFGRAIGSIPGARKAVTPSWWQPWMQSQTPIMGRLEAIKALTTMIAMMNSEADKSELLKSLRDIINLFHSRFWPAFIGLGHLPESQREAIRTNGFLPMPDNPMARELIQAIADMDDRHLKSTQKVVQRILKDR
jgi:hypothetical protein